MHLKNSLKLTQPNLGYHQFRCSKHRQELAWKHALCARQTSVDMNDAAWTVRVPLFVSVPSLPFKRNVTGVYSREVRRSFRFRGPRPCFMAGKAPPPVKPSFYKNPSKAIEKGGGFFIPGLRGPRLRYFVSVVSVSLLTLNHIASPQAQSNTLLLSECLALLAALTVFTTAVVDTIAESETSSLRATNRLPVRAVVTTNSTQLSAEAVSQESSQTTAWALAVCTDLTSATHVAAFRAGSVVVATENVQISAPQGSVIDRVISKSRSLYIANSADLPEDVTIPFLEDGSWSAFIVPVADGAVTFAVRASPSSGFSVEDRRWLEAFAPRLLST